MLSPVSNKNILGLSTYLIRELSCSNSQLRALCQTRASVACQHTWLKNYPAVTHGSDWEEYLHYQQHLKRNIQNTVHQKVIDACTIVFSVLNCFSFSCTSQQEMSALDEPWHKKTNNVAIHQEYTQLSLGFSLVWSVVTVCMKKVWVLNYTLKAVKTLIRMGRMPMLFWVFALCTLILLVLSFCYSYSFW